LEPECSFKKEQNLREIYAMKALEFDTLNEGRRSADLCWQLSYHPYWKGNVQQQEGGHLLYV
jgi:hypothetical protein